MQAPTTETERPEPKVTMTFEEFVSSPDVPEHREWVSGEVVEMPPIGEGHTGLGEYLMRLLGLFVEARAAGRVLYEPFQLRLPETSRSPDIMVVLAEHLDRLRPTYLDGPADLVVEVISPESRARDRGDKFYEYEAAGVPEYWLIDPDRQAAEFHRLDDRGVYVPLVPGDDGRLHSTSICGLWIRVAWLWERPSSLDVAREWGLI